MRNTENSIGTVIAYAIARVTANSIVNGTFSVSKLTEEFEKTANASKEKSNVVLYFQMKDSSIKKRIFIKNGIEACQYIKFTFNRREYYEQLTNGVQAKLEYNGSLTFNKINCEIKDTVNLCDYESVIKALDEGSEVSEYVEEFFNKQIWKTATEANSCKEVTAKAVAEIIETVVEGEIITVDDLINAMEKSFDIELKPELDENVAYKNFKELEWAKSRFKKCIFIKETIQNCKNTYEFNLGRSSISSVSYSCNVRFCFSLDGKLTITSCEYRDIRYDVNLYNFKEFFNILDEGKCLAEYVKHFLHKRYE